MKFFIENCTILLLLLFIMVTFLQSGIDKIVDWKGNLSWLKGHFAKSPFKNVVPLLLFTVLIIEVSAGLASTVGFVQILLEGESVFALIGGVLACIALLMLLLGQRIAKDYEGAKTIVIYFIPAIILVLLLEL